MFREGPQQTQAQTRIGDEHTVLPPRKAADAGNKPKEKAHRECMHGPVRQMTVVAVAEAARFLADESPQPQDGTNQESPGHRLIEHQHTSLERMVESLLAAPDLSAAADPITAIGADISPEVLDPFKQDESIKMRHVINLINEFVAEHPEMPLVADTGDALFADVRRTFGVELSEEELRPFEGHGIRRAPAIVRTSALFIPTSAPRPWGDDD